MIAKILSCKFPTHQIKQISSAKTSSATSMQYVLCGHFICICWQNIGAGRVCSLLAVIRKELRSRTDRRKEKLSDRLWSETLCAWAPWRAVSLCRSRWRVENKFTLYGSPKTVKNAMCSILYPYFSGRNLLYPCVLRSAWIRRLFHKKKQNKNSCMWWNTLWTENLCVDTAVTTYCTRCHIPAQLMGWQWPVGNFLAYRPTLLLVHILPPLLKCHSRQLPSSPIWTRQPCYTSV